MSPKPKYKQPDPKMKSGNRNQVTASNTADIRVLRPGAEKGLYLRGGTVYRYNRMVKGKRISLSLGTLYDKANAKAGEFNRKIADGVDLASELQRDSTTIREFLDNYFKSKSVGHDRKNTWRPNTARRRRAIFDNFLEWTEKHSIFTLAQMTESVAEEYIQARSTMPIFPNGSRASVRTVCKNGAALNTLRQECSVLKASFKIALKKKLISSNPFDDIKLPKASREEKIYESMTKDEQSALIEAAKEIDLHMNKNHNATFSEIIIFFLNTGLRLEELRKLEWSDLITDTKTPLGRIRIGNKTITEIRTCHLTEYLYGVFMRLAEGKKIGDRLFQDNKELDSFPCEASPIKRREDLKLLKVGDFSREDRTIVLTAKYQWSPKATIGEVPLNKTASGIIETLRKRNENRSRRKSNFIFAHHDGGSCRLNLLAYLHKTEDRMLQRESSPKNVYKLKIHSLRHQFGVNLRDAGVPLESIMGLMRHKNIEETLLYAPYKIEEGIKAISKLEVSL